MICVGERFALRFSAQRRNNRILMFTFAPPFLPKAILLSLHFIISQLPCFVKKKLWFFSEIFGKDSDEVKNMKIWKQMILFYLGGCAYVVLELLWRGRSHGSSSTT